ncbi:MAG: aminodeoxychorismate synthase component I [Campylobacterota bacterium]|nr:aminodeoxychorismate synthase component I [Campylobacterota bacterium]
MRKLNLKETLNSYGKQKEPFLFVIDYELKNYEIIPLNKLPENIKYKLDDQVNNRDNIDIEKEHIDFTVYKEMFEKVQNNILNGNTYLLNLTTPTKLKTDAALEEIYSKANAKYKLYYKDKFVCFSPESFIKIKNNKIYTYPMKGTIDASIQNAKEIIINDQKELAEHTMVVDLLRNDLSIVANNIKVEKFRYCDKIKAGDKELYQVSSQISAQLEQNWQNRIGNIITSILPAGSITGTPKKKTVEIIKEIENYDRGYFTGIFGVFDGENLDSAVMIRFIEKQSDNSLVYKSGGGITCDSEVESEYQEMCDKVYIP